MIEPPDMAMTKDSISDWLVRWIAKELAVDPTEIEPDKSLLNYSLSSVTAMMLVGDLEEHLGLTLPPTLVWDYPSISAIADHLVEQLSENRAGTSAATSVQRSNGNGATAGAGAGADAAHNLDDMSDQEVAALLNQLIADEHSATSL